MKIPVPLHQPGDFRVEPVPGIVKRERVHAERRWCHSAMLSCRTKEQSLDVLPKETFAGSRSAAILE